MFPFSTMPGNQSSTSQLFTGSRATPSTANNTVRPIPHWPATPPNYLWCPSSLLQHTVPPSHWNWPLSPYSSLPAPDVSSASDVKERCAYAKRVVNSKVYETADDYDLGFLNVRTSGLKSHDFAAYVAKSFDKMAASHKLFIPDENLGKSMNQPVKSSEVPVTESKLNEESTYDGDTDEIINVCDASNTPSR